MAAWRKSLTPLLIAEPQTTASKGYKYAFLGNENYASLRPHLRPEMVKKLEGPTIYIVAGGGPPFPRPDIIEEIARIEKEWKLV